MTKQRYVFVDLDELEQVFTSYGDRLAKCSGKYIHVRDACDIFYDIAAALEKAYGDSSISVCDYKGEKPQ